jgi:ribosomal protein L16 Arg81 hydroxylase
MHVYSSLAKNASNFGNHYDNTDVLIVQSVGIIKYSFDNNLEHTLYPGDSLFIPKYVNHNPIILEPRITLSFDFGS